MSQASNFIKPPSERPPCIVQCAYFPHHLQSSRMPTRRTSPPPPPPTTTTTTTCALENDAMKEVPYFSQWESRHLVSRFVSRELRSEDDPLWHRSGASSPEEYAQWSPNICGIACLKMLLAHRSNRIVPLLELVREAIGFGVYRPELGDTGKRLHYRPFVRWVGERYGIAGDVVEGIDSAELEPKLHDGHMLMASVHPGIRHDGFEPPSRGGHLVLVFGANRDTGDWLFHNPSGFDVRTQQNVAMPRATFDRYFANRGILIAP
ncbi:hypothetical protein [Burkholderia cenocepacia]|uniref:hypothetical protein n=1 Tax=Burkholderia cenocepacia TaxID=95486 RepID=UPI001ABA3438|nr:hypothetical protein [Burkholderia cenocepacia]